MAINPKRRRERLLEAARGYLTLEMPDHALRELRKIEASDEDLFDIYQLQGESLRQKKEHDEALSVFSLALEMRPDDLTVLMGLAWCFKRTDQLTNAISTMEQAYQSSPKEPIVLYNLSCYYALAGDKQQALSWLGKALKIEPTLRELIPDESDFDPLRNDPDFQFVIGIDEQESAEKN
ncbi:MAG: tetratricopeptide repeat protein [Planctomycetes bacterium]|nr:tetratricopeptide repeat protein [Planctomycetota bacterium]